MIINEQETTSNIQKVTYPDLSKYSLPQQYIVMTEIPTSQGDSILLNRKQFLLRFYLVSFTSFSLSLVIYLLGLFDWWLQIVTIFSYRYSSDYNDTFEDFQRKHGQSKTFEQYTEWKQNEVHLSTDYRWTFFLFLGLLILNIIIVAVARAHPIIKQFQKSLLFSQAVFLGFTFLGLAGYSRDRYWSWRDQCLIYISILSGLAGNSLISVILIRFDQIKFYQDFKCQILLISGVVINLIIFLLEGELDGNILLGEVIALYGFYYYHQLNTSLLKDPKTLPKYMPICALQINSQNTTQQPIEEDQIILKRRQLLTYILITIFCCLIVFGLSRSNPIFQLIISMGMASIISLFFDSQIASKSLQESDSFLAASLIWVDLCCPLKNVIRSIGNQKQPQTEN